MTWSRDELKQRLSKTLIRGLYIAHRLLGKLSGDRARIVPYALVAQPLTSKTYASLRVDPSSIVRTVHANDPVVDSFPRPKEVVLSRFAAGHECHVLTVKGEFAGHIWIAHDRYEEDEVRCTFLLPKTGECVWDYDVYVAPKYRLGRAMARMWAAVSANLYERGVYWSISRISWFNEASIKAHARLDAVRLQSALFLRVGGIQLSMLCHRPFLHLSGQEGGKPALLLQPPDEAKSNLAPAASTEPLPADCPLISVVIPCYNAERFIATTLDSVLNQDWPNLEVLVVDDGSSDDSHELLRTQYPQVRLIAQSNQGVAVARNTGIANAKGDWIAFVDADDIWMPGKLRAQWDQLQNSPGMRMSYTAWDLWHSTASASDSALLEATLRSAEQAARWTGPSGWIYSALLLDCEVWTSTVLLERSLLDEIGVFDPNLKIGEDYDLWLRASRVTRIGRVPKPLALYRIHPTSITRRVPAENYRGIVVERALRKWGVECTSGKKASEAQVQRALAKSWADYSAAQLAAGAYPQARQSAWACLGHDWQLLAGWKLLMRSIYHGLASATGPRS